MNLIYTHSSGGKIFQSGASSIPGTPDPWHYQWHNPGFYKPEIRKQIHDGMVNALKEHNIDILILASEYQPILLDKSLQLVSIPFDDSFNLSPAKTLQLSELLNPFCESLAKSLTTGKNILSTCWAGINRSSLVTGLILKLLRDEKDKPLMQGIDVVKLIQKNRGHVCLCNPIFRDLVLY